MATRASSHSLQAGQRDSEQLTKSPQFRVELSTLLPAHHLPQPQPHVRFERSGAALICSKWMHPTATAIFANDYYEKNRIYISGKQTCDSKMTESAGTAQRVAEAKL